MCSRCNSSRSVFQDSKGTPGGGEARGTRIRPTAEGGFAALTWNQCVLESIRNHLRYAGNGQLNPPMCWVGSTDSRLHIACGFDCLPKHNEPLQCEAPSHPAAETWLAKPKVSGTQPKALSRCDHDRQHVLDERLRCIRYLKVIGPEIVGSVFG